MRSNLTRETFRRIPKTEFSRVHVWTAESPEAPLRSCSSKKEAQSLQEESRTDRKVGDSEAGAHWTEASPNEQHWLDRRLPGLREWLENKNKKLWLQGVGERCRQYAQLQGKEEFIKEQLSNRYTEYLNKYAHMVVDDRSKTHLQMGALMLATKLVLSPWIKDVRDVESIIKSHMGDFTSPALRFLLRYVLYLSRDPYLSTKRRLNGLRLDYGRAFTAHVKEDPRAATLDVEDCFYQRLFQAEGCTHLLSACCCSQDKIWFENLDSHGIHFTQSSWKGRGDPKCTLRISHSRAPE